MVMVENSVFFLSVCLLFLMVCGRQHHFMMCLFLMELGILLSLVVVVNEVSLEGAFLVLFILVMGVAEGALGLAVLVKLSRTTGEDRVSVAGMVFSPNA